MPFQEKKVVPWWHWAVVGLLGAALGWFAAAGTVIEAGGHPFGHWPEAWRYADSDVPMISSADGFYFLYQAELAAGGATAHIPPLSRLTAGLSKISSQPVESAAFYLSLFAHLGLGLMAAAWARRLQVGLFPTFLAGLAIALMPAWLERAGPGQFDTDLVIALFWQIGLFFLADAASPGQSWRRLSANVGAALVSFAFLSWFWTSGIGLALVSLAVWAWLFLPKGRFWGLKKRLAVGGLGLVWLALVIWLPPEKAPAPGVLLELIHQRMTLVFGVRPELFYTSIGELNALSFTVWMEKIGGGVLGGLGLLATGLLLAIRRPAFRLPLFLALGAIVVGLRVNRLIYLGMFPLALSLGFLPALLSEISLPPRLSGRPTRLAGLALSLGLLCNCLHWASTRDLDIRWERGHDQLVEALRKEAAGRAGVKLWNWWDDGYFLAARADGMKPLFDGGSQTHTMAYIAAHPFMMDDRRAAARWMRFFALRGEGGLTPLASLWGAEAAYDHLERIFKAEGPQSIPADLVADVAKLPGGAGWLYPEGRVYWYLPRYFFKTSSWWVTLGLSREPDKALITPHLAVIGRDEFRYDETESSLSITQELWDRGYKNFGLVFNTAKNPLAPPWPTTGAPYIVYSEKSKNAYITDQLGIRTLPLYVMAPGGEDLPNFRALTVDEDWGGVWEVLP